MSNIDKICVENNDFTPVATEASKKFAEIIDRELLHYYMETEQIFDFELRIKEIIKLIKENYKIA